MFRLNGKFMPRIVSSNARRVLWAGHELTSATRRKAHLEVIQEEVLWATQKSIDASELCLTDSLSNLVPNHCPQKDWLSKSDQQPTYSLFLHQRGGLFIKSPYSWRERRKQLRGTQSCKALPDERHGNAARSVIKEREGTTECGSEEKELTKQREYFASVWAQTSLIYAFDLMTH